jgi:hypothetical protein
VYSYVLAQSLFSGVNGIFRSLLVSTATCSIFALSFLPVALIHFVSFQANRPVALLFRFHLLPRCDVVKDRNVELSSCVEPQMRRGDELIFSSPFVFVSCRHATQLVNFRLDSNSM